MNCARLQTDYQGKCFQWMSVLSSTILQQTSGLQNFHGWSQLYVPERFQPISNCDTYVYLRGNDIETVRNIARRADENLMNVFYMPVGRRQDFRRGQKPVNPRTNDLNSIWRKISRIRKEIISLFLWNFAYFTANYSGYSIFFGSFLLFFWLFEDRYFMYDYYSPDNLITTPSAERGCFFHTIWITSLL